MCASLSALASCACVPAAILFAFQFSFQRQRLCLCIKHLSLSLTDEPSLKESVWWTIPVTWNTHSSVINKSLQQIFKSRRRRNSVLFSAQDEMMCTHSDDAFTVFMPQQLDLKVDVRSGSLAFICGTVSDQRLIPVVKINLTVLIVTLLQLLILPAVITPDRRPRWQRQWSETDRRGVPFF